MILQGSTSLEFIKIYTLHITAVKILLKSALNTKNIEKWLATFHSLLIESWLGSQTPRQDLINDKRLKVS